MKLFARKEEKFECELSKIPRMVKVLEGLGFEAETSQIITNLVLENPETISFDDYARVRVRRYSSTPEDLFVEMRAVKGKNVTKKRIKLIEAPEVDSFSRFLCKNTFKFKGKSSDCIKILEIIAERDLKPYVFVEYFREAFNHRKLKIRITFDSAIYYCAVPMNINSFEVGKVLGQETIAIIKLKYLKKLPKAVDDLKKRLHKPRSKMERATYFLKGGKA